MDAIKLRGGRARHNPQLFGGCIQVKEAAGISAEYYELDSPRPYGKAAYKHKTRERYIYMVRKGTGRFYTTHSTLYQTTLGDWGHCAENGLDILACDGPNWIGPNGMPDNHVVFEPCST